VLAAYGEYEWPAGMVEKDLEEFGEIVSIARDEGDFRYPSEGSNRQDRRQK
jgi:hypothetical protein